MFTISNEFARPDGSGKPGVPAANRPGVALRIPIGIIAPSDKDRWVPAIHGSLVRFATGTSVKWIAVSR
jgi:hypothetical protein